ncbi:hypothetical protein DRN62_00190 [Nanoarchaeota archaeon]|nr:MAG: hypothetical protein DRN62_00190 [Nanoarchaeota archaeon]
MFEKIFISEELKQVRAGSSEPFTSFVGASHLVEHPAFNRVVAGSKHLLAVEGVEVPPGPLR